VTGFRRAVTAVVASVPAGSVVSYGEVAAEAGYPGAARAVGNLLAAVGADLPWWRVVRADGRLAVGKEAVQGALLAAEGVPTSGGRIAGRRPGRRLTAVSGRAPRPTAARGRGEGRRRTS
jgi:methylated-DNA-protein-cysteine methyltransferase-like protein